MLFTPDGKQRETEFKVVGVISNISFKQDPEQWAFKDFEIEVEWGENHKYKTVFTKSWNIRLEQDKITPFARQLLKEAGKKSVLDVLGMKVLMLKEKNKNFYGFYFLKKQ